MNEVGELWGVQGNTVDEHHLEDAEQRGIDQGYKILQVLVSALEIKANEIG